MLALGAASAQATPQQPPDYGIDFVTIGATGNPHYQAPPETFVPVDAPRQAYGGVNYEYRIGRYEVTTRQWMEFVNTFSTQSQQLAEMFFEPVLWGAIPDSNYSGPGRRYMIAPNFPSDAGQLPVGSITWRGAALYCNWLHNGKSSEFSSILTGAYEVSTFGNIAGGIDFTDQARRNPGARFWIPDLDEWVKAAYYDPNRHGTGQGGYWTRPNRRDEPLVYGPPGPGQANTGYRTIPPATHEWYVPLGAYTSEVSPWGLYDTSGAAQEWIEDPFGGVPSYGSTGYQRFIAGTAAGDNSFVAGLYDSPSFFRQGSVLPRPNGIFDYLVSAASTQGLRIASSVPSPGFFPVFIICLARSCPRRRKIQQS